MKKNIFFFLFATIFTFTGCSKNDTTDETPTEEVEAASNQTDSMPTTAPTEDLSNKDINNLTGLYVDKKIVETRPVAVVINNINKALPQSGIGQADIIYEVLAEGDITRLIAIFKDADSQKIGPIRSTRHYFTNIAMDYDAIYVHHGGSPQGYSSLDTLGVDHLDGMVEDSIFYRDPERVAQAGMYEHSSYTTSDGIRQGIQEYGFRTEIKEDLENPFLFYPVQAIPVNSIVADKITIPFSSTYVSYFEYDEATKLYKKSNAGGAHIDEETGEQLTFSNVIIQNTNIYIMEGDDAGRREVELVGEGTGYLATNGVYVPITWKKESENSQTKWYDESGKKLSLNKGKTYIAINNQETIFENSKMPTTTPTIVTTETISS